MTNKKIKELWNNKKDLLKNKKVIAIGTLGVVAVIGIGTVGYMMTTSDNKEVKNNKVVAVNKHNNKDVKESDVKVLLDKLKATDMNKLTEDEKKALETKIKGIEDMIKDKDYVKAKTEIEVVTKDIESKLKEVAKKEEPKTEEQKKVEAEKKVETEKKEVAKTEDTSNVEASNNNSTGGGSQQESTPTPPPIVETPAPTPPPVVEVAPTPPPAPPVVEQPSYPSLGEIKQRLISYGESLGYTYNSSLEYGGFASAGTSQMWSSGLGGSADGGTLFGSMEGAEFGITVIDLGNGYVDMQLWIV